MFSNPLKKSEPAATAKDQSKASSIPAAKTKAEPKKIDLNKPLVKDAIAKGKSLIKEGKTKADVAMEIFTALKDEDKDTVIAAFVQGAGLTEKGSVTYWYNCLRKAKKSVPRA